MRTAQDVKNRAMKFMMAFAVSVGMALGALAVEQTDDESKCVTITCTVNRLTFCEGEAAPINLSLTQFYSRDGYIFLTADDTHQLDYVACPLKTTGALISLGATSGETSYIQFLDGDKDLTLKAVLCSANDMTTAVAGFGSRAITFAVTNKPPQVSYVLAAGEYLSVCDNGGRLRESISSGVAKTFSLVADDVDADLNATGDDAMMAKWVIDGTTYEVSHDTSETFAVQHTFAGATTNALVEVYLKDKDMSAYPTTPNFTFYANVEEKPKVTITPSASLFVETDADAGASKIIVGLTERATSALTVRFTVSQAADGGLLKICEQAGSVVAARDAEGDEIPGAYDLIFGAGVKQKALIVSEMDGTSETRSGLELNACVTTDTLNADGVKWSEFYTKAEPATVAVQNAAPVIVCPSDVAAAGTNTSEYINTPFQFSYACSDVAADLAAGIDVEISIDGVQALSTNVTSAAFQYYYALFDCAGPHVVTVSFADKDGETSRQTLHYYCEYLSEGDFKDQMNDLWRYVFTDSSVTIVDRQGGRERCSCTTVPTTDARLRFPLSSTAARLCQLRRNMVRSLTVGWNAARF